MAMRPRDFECATGIHLEKEVRLVYFSPDKTFGEPVLHGNGRLVISGHEFLDILHRDLFGDHEGGKYDPEGTTWEIGPAQNIH